MGPVFKDKAKTDLAEVYPSNPAILAHELLEHPLLTLDALAKLAVTLPKDSIEYNPGALPIGILPEDVPTSLLGVAETIRTIENAGSWVVLKRIEQVPAYADLLRETLAEIEDVVKPRTGKMMQAEGFLFISSPNAVTPFHFDPEHNILLQIRGSKTMTVFPTDDEAICAAQYHEGYHLGKHPRNLPWQDSFRQKGKAFDLQPGCAIHMPVKAPHWVKVGQEPSISMSITWRSEWSYAEADARALNAMLRNIGLKPANPRAFPGRNLPKSLAWRTIRRVSSIVPQAESSRPAQ